ncbi:MAG: DNA alkylation repair protein [Clostridia bacterium]|nr:DNA alkylation repair protein [Clostridia bacterium]
MINLKQLLKDLGDEEYGKFNKKLCPDTKRQILGVRIPEMRKLAKDILKENEWKEVLSSFDDEYFEEIIMQGLIIGYAKCSLEEKIPYIKKFLHKIDSWAVSDTFVPTLKIKENDLAYFLEFIRPYFKSKKEFEVRFAIIVLLDYYITDKYVDKVIEILDEITHEGYYVKMGVAWCLAEIGIKFNEKAMKYLEGENNLDKFTFNKTLQKMIESYRIDDKQKQLLRGMKRK